ncbi:MAG TPA: Xaa-Pro peptidase family protein [Longimicrobiales bacterium]
MCRTRFLTAFLLLGIAAPAAAQIPKSEYAARRAALAERIGDGVVVAFGATEPMDDAANYRQLPAFRYLTGFETPDAAFLMVVRDGRPAQAMLYVPAGDPRHRLYTGFPPDSAETVARLGLGVRPLDALRPTLDALVEDGLPVYSVWDFASRDFARADSLTRGHRFIELLREAHPDVDVRNAHPIIDALRVVKSPAEIALLRKAVDITAAALEEAMHRLRPGMNEAEMQTLIRAEFRRRGAEGPSFHSIIGSGPNSTSYHYRANDRIMQAGDVVVMDVGALYDGYAADVTRTLPVGGTFTPEQRTIYQIVRDAQAAAEREVRPGAPVAAGEAAIREVLAQRLAALGLIQSPDATFDPPWAEDCARRPVRCTQAFLYMAHGPGHGIGLEVHDAGGHSYSVTGKFQEGEVFTIEPGIYIGPHLLDMLPDTPKNRAFIAAVRPVVERYDDIGIRIEDDYIVTATGVEWISRAPRELAEIEAIMGRAGT